MTKANEIPKIIWFLWFQGLEKAPYIVKQCLKSWKKHNPEWQVIVLDENSIKEYIDIEKIISRNHPYLKIQKISNIIRLNLLEKYGGVWADATCFCCKPLDTWLTSYMSESKFFAFYKPKIDRPISNFFLASSVGSPITSAWCKEHNLFWLRNSFSNQNNWIGKYVKTKIGFRLLGSSYESNKFWFLYRLMKLLRVYPHFCCHYTFALIIKKYKLCQQEWEALPKYSAESPLILSRKGLLEPLSEEVKQSIDQKKEPLYKLNWRMNQSRNIEGSILHYLLESNND